MIDAMLPIMPDRNPSYATAKRCEQSSIQISKALCSYMARLVSSGACMPWDSFLSFVLARRNDLRRLRIHQNHDVEVTSSAEIERRVVEIDAGTMELMPWDDVRSELLGASE